MENQNKQETKSHSLTSEFVPYEESLELKELGFDEPCISWYSILGKFSNDYSSPKKYNSEFQLGSYISAPTFSQAFRWFRENHDLNYVIVKAESWFYTINGCNTQEGFNTYEEAELDCLRKLIEIVKQNL